MRGKAQGAEREGPTGGPQQGARYLADWAKWLQKRDLEWFCRSPPSGKEDAASHCGPVWCGGLYTTEPGPYQVTILPPHQLSRHAW